MPRLLSQRGGADRAGRARDREPHRFAPARVRAGPARALRAEIDKAEESIHAATGSTPLLPSAPGIRSPWLMQVLREDSLVR